MPRIPSEIIEELLKSGQGLIKTAEADESKELKEYKNSVDARVGSDDISTIEALYGVTPEMPADMKYEFNIIERAHPNSVIIAPSYDKINGLVENQNERNNIMCNIARKPNYGNLTNPKYAHQDLLMELVRLGNEMDTRNQEELRKLADSCLIELSARQRQSLTKFAAWPAIILGVAAGLAIYLGAQWIISHTNDPDKGLLSNCNRAITKLNDLRTTSWYESEVDNTVKEEVAKLIKSITSLQQETVKLNTLNDQIYKPRNLSELDELKKLKAAFDDHGSDVNHLLEEFKVYVMEIAPMLDQAIANFSSEYYQKQHTKDTWLGEMTGWVGEAFHGRWGIVANDYVSAVNALVPLKTALNETMQHINELPHIIAQKEEEIKNSVANLGKNPEAAPLTSSPIPQISSTPAEETHWMDLIKGITGQDASPEEIEAMKMWTSQ